MAALLGGIGSEVETVQALHLRFIRGCRVLAKFAVRPDAYRRVNHSGKGYLAHEVYTQRVHDLDKIHFRHSL